MSIAILKVNKVIGQKIEDSRVATPAEIERDDRPATYLALSYPNPTQPNVFRYDREDKKISKEV